MNRLPMELLIHICYHLPTTRDVAHFAMCVGELQASGDVVYETIARLRWGDAFWQRAFSRMVNPVFVSFRHELKTIEDFEDRTRRLNTEVWTIREYFTFWDAIDAYGKLPVPTPCTNIGSGVFRIV